MLKSWISGREAAGRSSGGTDEEILTACTDDMLEDIKSAERFNNAVYERAEQYVLDGLPKSRVRSWVSANLKEVPTPCFDKTETYMSMLVEATAHLNLSTTLHKY